MTDLLTSVISNKFIHVTEEYWILSRQMFKREKKKKQEDEGRKNRDFGEVLAVTVEPLFSRFVPRGCLPLYTCSLHASPLFPVPTTTTPNSN
jgi:hypothetical protein